MKELEKTVTQSILQALSNRLPEEQPIDFMKEPLSDVNGKRGYNAAIREVRAIIGSSDESD